MAQKKNTRSKRAAAKTIKKAPVKTQKPVEVAPVTPQKISNVIRLSTVALKTLWQHKKYFSGVLGIYATLSIVFVGGLGTGAVASDTGNRLLDALADYTGLLGGATTSGDAASSVYQLFLTLFISLALIWSLRQLYAGNKVRIRDAYYQSMAPLVPFMLVLLWLCLQLLPLLIATSIYQFVVLSGVAASIFEVIIWFSVAIVGALISAFLISTTLFALIIVTLPDMTPVAALRLAKKLVAGRRLKVLRKLAFMPLVLLVLATVILLPVVLVSTVLAQIIILLLGPLLIAVGHSYTYALYRELMDD